MIFAAALASSAACAQLRLDAGLKIGHSTVKQFQTESIAYAFSLRYAHDFSYGADVRVGYEFKHGIGLYSGISYDRIKFRSNEVSDKFTDRGENIYYGNFPHASDFITIPLHLEYRCCHDIIRPYVGYGLGLQVHHISNYEEEGYGSIDFYTFNSKVAVPTFMFGINLEYKRFIVGFGRRKDLTHFWEEERCKYIWKASQNALRVAYRIF